MKQPTSNPRMRNVRTAIAMAALAVTSLASFSSHAASGNRSSDRQAIEDTYNAERADCLAGNTTQDQASCLYEARSVRRDSLAGLRAAVNAGAVTELKEPDYHANALMRCDALPADARSYCSRRVEGEGTAVGSVAEGIIVRELSDPQLASLPTDASDETSMGSGQATTSAGGEAMGDPAQPASTSSDSSATDSISSMDGSSDVRAEPSAFEPVPAAEPMMLPPDQPISATPSEANPEPMPATSSTIGEQPAREEEQQP